MTDQNISEEELETLRRDLEQVVCGGLPVLLTPLPRRVRLRLWLIGRIDDAAYWLVCRGHNRAAVRLWKLCRVWT